MFLVYAIFGSWHEDSPRTFVCSLPRPLPPHTVLWDANDGENLGEIVKVWPTPPSGRTPVRIRLAPRFSGYGAELRADLLAHRKNVAIDEHGRLLLVGQIDTKQLSAAAADAQRGPQWLGSLHVVG